MTKIYIIYLQNALYMKPQSQLVVSASTGGLQRGVGVELQSFGRTYTSRKHTRWLFGHVHQTPRFPCEIWKRLLQLCFTQGIRKVTVQFVPYVTHTRGITINKCIKRTVNVRNMNIMCTSIACSACKSPSCFKESCFHNPSTSNCLTRH